MEGDYRRVTKSKRSLDVVNLLDKYRRCVHVKLACLLQNTNSMITFFTRGPILLTYDRRSEILCRYRDFSVLNNVIFFRHLWPNFVDI
jgi:hypothetical protein